MSKCSLIIDGNWLLMSRRSVYNSKFNINLDESIREAAKFSTLDLMSRSIVLTLNKFRNIVDNVILVCDSKSWRKSLAIPKSLSDTTYKGNRVGDDDTDWERIYESLNILERNCRDLGITIGRASGAEGDDCIMHISKTLNNSNKNAIIWSSDNDLKQLINYNGNAWTMWYNKDYGIFAHKDMECYSEMDLFLNFEQHNRNLPIITAIEKQTNLKCNYINPEDIIMEKIICGDASDNILSIIRKESNGAKKRIFNVSGKMWNELKEELGISTIKEFFNNKDNIIEALFKLNKFKDCELSFNEVSERFDYNTKLVYLNETVFPENVKENLSKIDIKDYDVSYIINNYKVLCNDYNESYVESLFS